MRCGAGCTYCARCGPNAVGVPTEKKDPQHALVTARTLAARPGEDLTASFDVPQDIESCSNFCDLRCDGKGQHGRDRRKRMT